MENLKNIVQSLFTGAITYRRAAPTVLITSIAAFLAVMAFISNRVFASQAEEMEAAQFSLMATTLDFNVNNMKSRALLASEAIGNIATIRKMHTAKDREGLLSEVQKSFEVLKEKYGVDQIQFHTLPAVSLLRVHSPKNFGDDLSTSRPGVVAVNNDKQARAAPTITRTGFAVLGIVPVYSPAGEHVGSMEVGILFRSFIGRLKEAYGFDSAVLVDGEIFQKTAVLFPDKNIYADENRIGNYLNYRSTDWARMKELVTPESLQQVNGEVVTYSRDAFGSSYGVVLYPLRNTAGVRIGVLAAAMDMSGPRTAQSMFTILQIALTILGIILTSGVIMIVLRGFLLGPLAEISAGFGNLANGDRGGERIDTDAYCAEIQDLNEHLNRLRKAKG